MLELLDTTKYSPSWLRFCNLAQCQAFLQTKPGIPRVEGAEKGTGVEKGTEHIFVDFACLAMVVGLYGFAYLEVASRPDRGWALAAVGMAGKILGAIGLAVLIVQGRWPLSGAVLCLTNDLIWWVPFALYLQDAWPAYRRDWA